MKTNFEEFLKKIDFNDPSEYDFDKDMGGRSGEQEKEDTTWTGDVY